MTKKQLFNYFNGQISMKAICKIDGEWQIIGKWCRVSIDDDGLIDLFICNSADMYAGLGARKLKNIVSSLKSRVGTTFTEGNGEAWGKVRDKEVILQNITLLGIRRKRQVNYQHMADIRSNSPVVGGVA